MLRRRTEKIDLPINTPKMLRMLAQEFGASDCELYM